MPRTLTWPSRPDHGRFRVRVSIPESRSTWGSTLRHAGPSGFCQGRVRAVFTTQRKTYHAGTITIFRSRDGMPHVQLLLFTTRLVQKKPAVLPSLVVRAYFSSRRDLLATLRTFVKSLVFRTRCGGRARTPYIAETSYELLDVLVVHDMSQSGLSLGFQHHRELGLRSLTKIYRQSSTRLP